MNQNILKLALIGKTNAGKSTLINSLIGEKISIVNRKINTTQEYILGIKNIKKTQFIFYDTPGSNFLKSNNILQKKLKINIWQSIDTVDILIYLIDVLKYNFEEIKKDVLKISEVNKPILFIFNKIDLFDNKKILLMISNLNQLDIIDEFFLISAKYNNGIDDFLKFLDKKAYKHQWIYQNNEITDKDDIYISNECSRNALLKYVHKEIPYNIHISNVSFKFLKNNELKIKQLIELKNNRYKPIIIGKNGANIKRIREQSQNDIANIFKCKVHLYLTVIIKNEK